MFNEVYQRVPDMGGSVTKEPEHWRVERKQGGEVVCLE